MDELINTLLKNLPALITAVLAVITYLNSRKQAKLSDTINKQVKEQISPLKEELASVREELRVAKEEVSATRKELEQNNLETARVDLMQAIEHAPTEHRAILDQADYYFVTLGGDAWMSGIFQDWAKKEKVDISYILKRAKHLREHLK